MRLCPLSFCSVLASSYWRTRPRNERWSFVLIWQALLVGAFYEAHSMIEAVADLDGCF